MKRLLLSIVLIIQVFLLTGCWDIKEIQNLIYFNAIGFDHRDGEFIVYVQASDFSSVAKSESGKPAQEAQIWVGKGKGKTLYEAIFDLYSTTQMRAYWGHVTAIVLSEAMIKDGIQTIFDFMERFAELRSNVWVYSTRDSIEDILGATSFFRLSTLYSILHEPKEVYNLNSRIPPLYFFRFMSDYTERGQTVLVPTLILNKNQWQLRGKGHPLLSVNGVDVMQRGKYKGWLDVDKLKGLPWMREETERVLVNLFKDQKLIAETILGDPRIKVKPTIQNGQPKFSIEVKVEAKTNEINVTPTVKEIKDLIKQQLNEDIRETYKEGLKIGADVLQLGYQLYRKDPKGWYQAYGQKQHRFPLDQDSITNIDIKVKIISTGKMKFRDGYNPAKR